MINEKQKSIILVNPISSGAALKSLVTDKGFALITVYTLSRSILSSEAFNQNVDALEQEASIVYFKDGIDNVNSLSFKEKHNVVAVVPASESGVIFAAELSELYGLTGNPVDRINACRDKFHMRESLAKANLKHPKYKRVYSTEEAVDFATSALNYPVVVKAPSSSGTAQISLCENQESITNAVHDIISNLNVFGEKNPYALLEEYLEGEEYSINGFVDNGEITITDIWSYRKKESKFFKDLLLMEDLHDLKFIQPSNYIKDCVKSMGINHGMFHGEIVLNNDNEAVLIELASRIAGLGMASLSKKVSNFDPFEAHLSAFIGDEYKKPKALTMHATGAMVCYPSTVEGTVEELKGIEEIKELASYDDHHPFIKKGDIVSKTENLFGVAMTANLINKNRDQLLSDIDKSTHFFSIATE